MMIYMINAEASSTRGNPGMKTVDMAWDIFLEKNNLKQEYKRFSAKLDDSSVFISSKIKLDYNGSKNFQIEDLNDNDLLVYWGDFLHSHHYLDAVSNILSRKEKVFSKRFLKSVLSNEKKSVLPEEDSLPFTYSIYLPNYLEKKWKGTISFGTTLVGDNDFEIFSQKSYQNAFVSFVKNLDRAWTRDVMSALQISHIKNDYQTNFLGVDAALLIDKKDYEMILDEPSFEIPKSEYIVTHFTRSEESINKLMNLAIDIKKEMEMPMYWIPWLTPLSHERFNTLDSELRQSVDDIGTTSYSDLIHLLKNSKFVITDTYHLALIGWRLGKPVICLGSGLQYPESTLHDKKKEIFYTMHNMLPLYFYTELIDDRNKVLEFVQFVKSQLNDGQAIQNIIDKIRNQAESVEKDLANYFRILISQGK